MPPIVKESDSNTAIRGINSANPPASPSSVESSPNKTQPVALEVSVTVNGVRTAEGSDKREPFSETTKTVLVFSNGAVIRLSATLSPGQLLFLANEKTKKEVVCQVVKSKNYRNVSGYIEVEFTEASVGFWGMRFPSDRIAPAPAVSPLVTTVSPALPAVPPAPPSSVELPAPPAVLAPVSAEPLVSLLVPPVVKEEPAPLNSGEVSASFLEPSAPPANKWSPEPESLEDIKLHTARLQEQLSSMLFSGAESPKSESLPLATISREKEAVPEIASKVIEISQAEPVAPPQTSLVQNVAPAPAPITSLDEENIKIPAWLEPLARNSLAPASTQELIEREKSKSVADKAEAFPATPDVISPSETESTPELRIPSFGSQLPMDENQDHAAKTSRGSNKGFLIGAVAAGICLLAAGGFWYWRQQGGSVHATAASPAAASTEVPIPSVQPASTSAAQTNSASSFTQAPPVLAIATPVVPIHEASENTKSIDPLTPAASKVLQSAPTPLKSRSSASSNTEPRPQPAKTSLGEIHLATPKVNRKPGSQETVSSDPGLTMNAEGAIPGSDSMNGGLAAGSVRQPAAPVVPLPVGGDVKPAKLLSSVPPAYPLLAKNQHLTGDVKIDALIEANGRVTSMNVLSGPTLLHQAAMDALRQWKYQPATLDGKPVSMHLTVTLQFRLQ